MTDIPAWLSHLPRHGSFVVPYFTAYDADGVPNFRAHDRDRHRTAITERLCGVCGHALQHELWLSCGLTELEQGWTYMPAMHKRCMHYAMQVCPFLASPDHGWRRNGTEPDCARVACFTKPEILWVIGFARYQVRMLQSDNGSAETVFFGRPLALERWHYVDGRLVREESV